MKRKTYFKVLLVVVSILLFLIFLISVIVEPWFERKIKTVLSENNKDYIVEIDKVHISLIKSVLELDSIKIRSNKDQGSKQDLKGEIASIRFKGIKLIKAIFRKDINIREVIIFNSRIDGKLSSSKEISPPTLMSFTIRIGSVFFNKLDLSLGNTSTAKLYSVKEGVLRLYDLQAEQQDTLSLQIVKQFDFAAKELVSVSSDSMYSLRVCKISYSAASGTLAADSFFIQPNYTDYEFTSKYKFQKTCIEARFTNVYFYDFNAADFSGYRSLISSYGEIGNMEMKVFRDKRKEFRHVNKTVFQEMIYNYPGIIRIDSIGVLNGDITYTEHADKANDPGRISFNDINAEIYKITNDTIYKTKSAFLELKAKALLMGKSRMTILLKSRIFDSNNTFSMYGTLSGLEANELNPILEKNAFIYATSGKIDAMNFSFTANNTKSTGKMTLLYHGLDIAVKNKKTDDTTAIRERLISFIANIKVIDSNPIHGDAVRVGIIDYNRDPERFLFGYFFKSILSGVKSSLLKNPDKR
jgi:hypothetical protein